MGYLLGFLIACAVGLTGVGAGSITAPILILFFHLKPAVAVGTALTFAAVIKLAVLPIYLRRQQVNYRVLLLLCAGGIPGVVIGIEVLKKTERGGPRARNLSRPRNHDHCPLIYQPLPVVATPGCLGFDRSILWLPPIAAIIGAEVGVSSAGAGALGAVALLSLTQLSPALVVGTDMVFGLTVSTIGSGLHLFIGHYDAHILLQLCIGGVLGAVTGALLSSRIPSRALQLVLFLCLIGLGVQLCLKAMG